MVNFVAGITNLVGNPPALSKDIRVEPIPKFMSYRHKLMVFLVAMVSSLENNLTAFLIVESCIQGLMLITSTDAIVTLSLFTYSSSGISLGYMLRQCKRVSGSFFLHLALS